MANNNKEILGKFVSKKQAQQDINSRKQENLPTSELNKIARTMITTEAEFTKVAKATVPFIKTQMDYMGFARNLAITDDYSSGEAIYYDKDFPDAIAMIAAHNGSVGIIDTTSARIYIREEHELEITSAPIIPLKLVYTRTFKTLERLKVKTEYGLRMKEDIIFLSLLDILCDVSGQEITSTGGFTKRLLNRGMKIIEKNRLVCFAIVCGAGVIQDVRSWKYEDIGPLAIDQILQSGYAGKIYGGMDWYVTDQIDDGVAYLLTTPEYLAWIPYRTEVDVDPVYLKLDSLIGFKGYLLEAIVVHNSFGAVKIEFDEDLAEIYS